MNLLGWPFVNSFFAAILLNDYGMDGNTVAIMGASEVSDEGRLISTVASGAVFGT